MSLPLSAPAGHVHEADDPQSYKASTRFVHPESYASYENINCADNVQAKEVHTFLEARNRVDGYPLFNKVYQICWEDVPVEKLTEGL